MLNIRSRAKPLVSGLLAVLLAGCTVPSANKSRMMPAVGRGGHQSATSMLLGGVSAGAGRLQGESSLQDQADTLRSLAAAIGASESSIQETSDSNANLEMVRAVFSSKIFFESDHSMPRQEAVEVLDVIAGVLKKNLNPVFLTVLGHTDAEGSSSYNFDLSRRRAHGVLAALIERGVNAGQLSAVAIGKAQPIAPNDTEDGRALNRRVEFIFSNHLQTNLGFIQRRASQASDSTTDTTVEVIDYGRSIIGDQRLALSILGTPSPTQIQPEPDVSSPEPIENIRVAPTIVPRRRTPGASPDFRRSPMASDPLTLMRPAAPNTPEIRQLAPPVAPQIRRPDAVRAAPLGDETSY